MRFKPLLFTMPALLALAACSDSGRLQNPFEKPAPFIPSAVPADFAVQVDENHDTFQSRQHIAQVISVTDSMSTTTYTTRRDLNNGISNRFSQETPLKPEQLQAMWNAVSRYDLMNRSTPWINWYSGADLYKRDSNTIQIRANGQTAVYRQNNGFPGAVRPLMLQVQAVRLPLSQDANTRVITPPEPTQDTPTPPAEPTTAPSLPGPPLMPEASPGTPPPPIHSNGTNNPVPIVPVEPSLTPHDVLTPPPPPPVPPTPATQAITPMEAPKLPAVAPPKFTPDNIKNGTSQK